MLGYCKCFLLPYLFQFFQGVLLVLVFEFVQGWFWCVSVSWTMFLSRYKLFCGVRGICQKDELVTIRVGLRMRRDFWCGQSSKKQWTRRSDRQGTARTVGENMRMERAGPRENTPTAKHLFTDTWALSQSGECAICTLRRENVRPTAGCAHSRRTHGSRYYLGAKPSQVFSPIPSWTFPPGIIFHQLFYNEAHSSEEATRFQVAGLSSNSWWSYCIASECRFTAKYHFQLCELLWV